MSEYKLMDNYVIFKNLGSDSIGTNYRAGEIKDNKPSRHRMLTVVHPFLARNPSVWKRIKILLEGIKKSNIPNLYSPERIEVREDKTTLVYPLLQGQTFEQVLEDASKKNAAINFDLAFSIALAIADLIDTGSSIVVSGKKSFHGFLTPDNIIVDYDGKIFLKNYGIFPYLNQDDEIFSEMVKKYGAWIAPEFLRKEKPIPQSDIYHLGYIIYRILTGNYFSCLPEEDFESKFSNIAFTQHIHSSDKDFLTNIIYFFKKTLNPDPAQRFVNIREFKDFISGHFKIEELSSVTFNLAYFMNSLYLDTAEEEKRDLENELAYVIPVKSEERKEVDDALVENILIGLDEKEKAKSKVLLFSVFIAVVAVAIAAFLYINMTKTKKAQQDEVARQAQLSQEQLAAMKKKHQEQIKNIEEKIATTEGEKQARQEELDRIKKEYQDRRKKEMEKQRQIRDQINKKAAAEKPEEKPKETETKQAEPVKEDTGKTVDTAPEVEEGPQRVEAGQLISFIEATVKPEKIAGKNPGEAYILRKKYAGRIINVLTSILVNEKGDVDKIRILGSAPGDIKTNILKTVKKWKFKPAQKDGVKVKVWIQRRFNLRFKKF
ncbi:MAG: energy transducer TonB [Candidatus Aminicenantes bacterium]|nr:energy transducer TonB [Candidatus Aminicenantes bacterium]